MSILTPVLIAGRPLRAEAEKQSQTSLALVSDSLSASCHTCSLDHLQHTWNTSTAEPVQKPVFDWSCSRMRWGYAYFHLVMDCLLAVTTQLPTLIQYSARNTADVYTIPEVLRFWPWRNTRLIRYACKPCLRDLAYAYEGLKPFYEPVACTHTLLLVRTGTRKLRNYPSLWVHLARVSAPYDVPVVPFFGNESLSEMIRLFSSACAVVGTHGAGHANTIFSRKDALVVEISTYMLPRSLSQILIRSLFYGAPMSTTSQPG
jgi:hypothetical protein